MGLGALKVTDIYSRVFQWPTVARGDGQVGITGGSEVYERESFLSEERRTLCITKRGRESERVCLTGSGNSRCDL